MVTFSEYCRRRSINEFSEMRPEDVSSVNLVWSAVGAYADFQVGGQPLKVIFSKDWYDLTKNESLSGYTIMLRGPRGFESTGMMGTQGQMVYRQMILAAMNLVKNAPKDHPAEFFKWDPYEDKMDLVYMAMYNRFMKRDWAMLKLGLAANRQALASKISSMSDADAAELQKSLAGAESQIQSEIGRLREIRRQNAAMRRHGETPNKRTNEKK